MLCAIEIEIKEKMNITGNGWLSLFVKHSGSYFGLFTNSNHNHEATVNVNDTFHEYEKQESIALLRPHNPCYNYMVLDKSLQK